MTPNPAHPATATAADGRPEGPAPTGRWGRRSLIAGLALLLGLSFTPSPYVIRQPGPAFNALSTAEVRDEDGERTEVDVITIDGAESYDADGALTVMTVNIAGNPEHRPSWFELATSYLVPSRDVLPMEVYYPPGQTAQERSAENAELMTHSQGTAVAAALRHLGHEVGVELVVADVPADSPSAGILEVGDVLLRYGDDPVTDLASIRAIELPTAPIDIAFRRDGEERVESITPRLTATPDGDRALLGVTVREDLSLPFDVDIELGDVGGPSAGMMFALAIVDKLEPGDLTGGLVVAGSGSIGVDGEIGPIGGIRQKLFAAVEIGADYFLADEANCAEALAGGVPGELPVYAVDDLAEAIAVVEANASGDADGLRTCADALAANAPQA